MPEFTRVQLVLLELAVAAFAAGFALHALWRWAGLGAAIVLGALAVVPLQRRWAYQLLLSYLGMVRRRRSIRGPGLQSLLGGYRVVTVPPGRQGIAFGAVRVRTSWTVPLELGLDGLLNDDAPIPLDQLATLLRVEGVPLSTVRLVTLVSPARPGVASGSLAGPPRLASRYCLLTLNVGAAPAAIAERGGSDAAVGQVLRRCVVRAEEVFEACGARVRRLDDTGVAGLFAVLLGPAASPPDGTLHPTVETWRDIRVAGTSSTTFAVVGTGADVTDRLAELAGRAPTATAVTTLVLRLARRDELRTTLLLRISGPGTSSDRAAASEVEKLAGEVGLVLQRLGGEQGTLLGATTAVDVSERSEAAP